MSETTNLESKYVNKEFDQFRDLTTIKHLRQMVLGSIFGAALEFKFQLRQIKTKEITTNLLDCNIRAKDWFHARYGSIIFNCDQQNYTATYHESDTNVEHIGDDAFCFEFGYYEIPEDVLAAICACSTLKIRVSGNSLYQEPNENWCEEFKGYCRQFYNNAIDSTKYQEQLALGEAAAEKRRGSKLATIFAVVVAGAVVYWLSTDGEKRAPQEQAKVTAAPQSNSPPVPTQAAPAPVAVQAESLRTRYGTVSVGSDHSLLLDGKPTDPKFAGNMGVSLIEKFAVGDSDVVLIQDIGGSSCPATYHLLELTKAGSKMTSGFGTCNDETTQLLSGSKVVVSMSGFTGPHEAAATRELAARRKHSYSYEDGVVTELAVGVAPGTGTSATALGTPPSISASAPVGAASPPASAPWAPSFDCSKASTSAERLVCTSRELSDADLRMAQAYKAAMSKAADRDSLRDAQVAWRKNERDVCADVACMLAAYQNRMARLTR